MRRIAGLLSILFVLAATRIPLAARQKPVKHNKPPTVVITTPASGATFKAPAAISISANAADSDGSIRFVKFYAGAAEICSISKASFDCAWNNVQAGSYGLTAVATNNTGATATSAPVTVTVSAATSSPSSSAPLVQPSNLIYQGAFRVPGGQFGSSNLATFAYGGTALAFNATRNSLFLVGHDWGQLVAEISIPAIRTGLSVTDLATASVLQSFRDPSQGLLSTVNPGGIIKVGGLLPYQNQLYLTAYDYYDAARTQVYSHFVSGLDLSVTGGVLGPYQVGTGAAGFVDGYFGLVPTAWQAALGGPVLNGQCCIPIITRTSFGPALFTIDPTRVGVTEPLPVTPLVYYPAAYPLAPWDGTNAYFNGSTDVTGVVFPEETRSVLFFGRHGLGTFCYGPGTSDPALAGQPANSVYTYCYDPTSSYQGNHAYPYAYYVWAYDALDLAAAATGQTQPWTVTPYAVWTLNFPFAIDDALLLGATYDPQTGRLFVSQALGDGALPLIHVFTVHVP